MTRCEHVTLQHAWMCLLVVTQVADVKVLNIHSGVKLVKGQVRGSIRCHSVLTTRDNRCEGRHERSEAASTLLCPQSLCSTIRRGQERLIGSGVFWGSALGGEGGQD